MNNDTELLRQEIIESQKQRIDLFKYKLLIIAVLGAVGLGIGEFSNGNYSYSFNYVLCIIPFACIYIDLLCYHNNIRILIISNFLNRQENKYECFINELSRLTKKRDGVRYFYNLEDLIIHWSSIFLSALIVIYAIFVKPDNPCLFFIVGSVGCILPFVSLKMYINKIKTLKEVSDDLDKEIKE